MSVGLWLDRLFLVAGVGCVVAVLLGAVRGVDRAAPRNPPWRTWRKWELAAPVLLALDATSDHRSAVERWGRVLVGGAFALQFVRDWAGWWRRGRHLARPASRDILPLAEPGPVPVGAWACMPDFGDRVGEGVVTSWLKQEGDAVQAGEPLLEVSTDKVDTEIPSPADGILARIAVPAGNSVVAGTRLALISAIEPAVTADPQPVPEVEERTA